MLLAAIVALMWIVEGQRARRQGAGQRGGHLSRNIDHLWAIFTSRFCTKNFYPILVTHDPAVFMGVIIALARGQARLVTLVVM